MNALPKSLDITVATLALLGGVTLAGAFVTGTFFTNTPFLVLALFAVVCAPLTVVLWRQVRLSALHVFVLAAVVLVGTAEAVGVAILGALALLVVSRPRSAFHRAVALVTGYPLEAALAGGTFWISGGRAGSFDSSTDLVALLFATLVYYFAHTLIGATLAGFEERVAMAVVWFDRYAWMLPSFLSAGTAAALVGLMQRWAGMQAFVLLVPFAVLLFQHYRMRAERDRERERFRAEIDRQRSGAGGGSFHPREHPPEAVRNRRPAAHLRPPWGLFP